MSETKRVCTGACIFGKCPHPVCVKYEQKTGDATQIRVASKILTDNCLTDLKSDHAGLGIAVDIGTTTMVAYLYDLKRAECLAVQSALNPQITLGVDVISRIKYCGDVPDGTQKMQRAVTDQLNELFLKLAAQAQVETGDIRRAVITGNTTMLHLLCGLSPVAMGVVPFEAETLFGCTKQAEEIGLALTDVEVYLVACISSFVGGDITSAILASKMTEREEISLLMDLGTNGELALGNRAWLKCTSTAAGPAFEGSQIEKGMAGVAGAAASVYIKQGNIEYTVIGGGKAAGLCGSGILDLAALAVRLGMVDETGRVLDADEAETGVRRYLKEVHGENAVYLDEHVYLTQKDFRQLQTAKAAVAAGVLCLIHEAGIALEDVAHVYIAGGFGNYMEKNSAVDIGLLDASFEDKIECIGNAAGSGAIYALLEDAKKDRCAQIARMGEHVELGGNPYFMEKYVDCMMFEVLEQ